MSICITFVLDEEGTPMRVKSTRLGVECKLTGPCSEELVQETRTMVQTIVAQIGEESTFKTSVGKPQDPEGKELKPTEAKAGKLPISEPTKGEEEKKDPKVHPQPLLNENDGKVTRPETLSLLTPESNSPQLQASSHFWLRRRSRNP